MDEWSRTTRGSGPATSRSSSRSRRKGRSCSNASKHGHRSVAVALPAGYTEEGERAIDTARRELREEAVYEAEDWRSLGSFTVDGNYGLCVEHAFLARDARRPKRERVANGGP